MARSDPADDIPLPPPPPEPDAEECCGAGCDPCVLDLYEERLERWRRRCEAIRTRHRSGPGRSHRQPPRRG